MSIPQSCQFLGQIVRLLCSLQNVLQMIPLALQSHLQAAREIISDTNTFLYRDRPDPGCYCCLQVTDCLGVVFVHSVLQITPKLKIIFFFFFFFFKSGECGANSMSHLLLISRSSNLCLSHNRVLLEVWGAAPSCWNHCSSLVIVLRRPSATQVFLNTTVVSVTISSAACKCACNTKGVICYTFWRKYKSRTIWPTNSVGGQG